MDNDNTPPGDKQRLELEICDVCCPECRTNWVSTLSAQPFGCPNCLWTIDPSKHVVLRGETEVN